MSVVKRPLPLHDFSISILLCLLVLLSMTNVAGQKARYIMEVTGMEEGLSQSRANCILQDAEGLLWIGTQNGLNLFDGNELQHFLYDPWDTTTLSNNYVLALCEDHNGLLWIGTMAGGLNRFDRRSNHFTTYPVYDIIPENSSGNTVWCVDADETGKIWIGTSWGLSYLDSETGRFHTFRKESSDKASLPSDLVTSVFVESADVIWAGTGEGLARIETVSGEYRISPFFPDELQKMGVWSIVEDDEGNLMLGTNNGLISFSKSKRNFTIIDRQNNGENTVWSVCLQNPDVLWAGTGNGLRQYHRQTHGWVMAEQITSIEGSETGNVWWIKSDTSGLIWAATDIGLVKITPARQRFRLINDNPANGPVLSHTKVNAILVDRNKTLWVGTEGGGLNRLDKGAGLFKVYRQNDQLANPISSNNIWSLQEDDGNILWVGTYPGGLCAFDVMSERFRTYVKQSDTCSISNNRVLTLLRDSQGDIWAGTRGGGLNRYDASKDCFVSYMHDQNDSRSISSNTIISLAEDTEGFIWAGTYEGGLCRFDPAGESFTVFKNESGNRLSLSNNNVWEIFFSRDGTMWVGTEGGLNHCAEWNGDSLEFVRLTTKDGLSSNTVFGIAEGGNGDLWISAFRGISRLKMNVFTKKYNRPTKDISAADPFEPLFINYDRSDGLQGMEFSQGARFQSPDGTIFFGGVNGLNIFHPDSVKENSFNPKIMITGMKVLNRPVTTAKKGTNTSNSLTELDGDYFLPSPIRYMDQIRLSHTQNMLSFSFTALDYATPRRITYAFRLDGVDNTWNITREHVSATYANLAPGDYLFRVRGTNSDGRWSSHEACINLIIVPPFWQTTWFLALLLISIALSATLIIFWIFQNQKRKALINREMTELQLKTIKNQIDPHFTFNAINMIGSMVYKNDPDTVYDHFSKLARLIRSTLQDSARISRPLKEEIEFIINYIEIQQARFKDVFDFQLDIDKETDMSIEVPKMIIQTYVENAIKHGLVHKQGKGRLTIGIKGCENGLQISIEDNGIGRRQAKMHSRQSTGMGLKIVQQIFTMYKKLFNFDIRQKIDDLTDEQGKPAGTRVTVIINKC